MYLLPLVLLKLILAFSHLPLNAFASNPVLVTMEDLVDSIADNFLAFNDQTQDDSSRHRRSVPMVSISPPSEYITVTCNLTCSIEPVAASGLLKRVLKCSHFNPARGRSGVSVRTVCVEHRSGKLLHMSLSTDGLVADYLDHDFANTLQETLGYLTPEPEFLYLTLDVPLLHLRRVDFAGLGQHLRRLSVNLGKAISVDTGLVANLSLETFSVDGCPLKSTHFTQIHPSSCIVDLVYTCPEMGDVEIEADRTTKQKHCHRTVQDNVEPVTGEAKGSSLQTIGSLDYCGCHHFQKLIEVINSTKSEQTRAMERFLKCPEYRQLLFMSIVVNIVLICTLLVICLTLLVVSVKSGGSRGKGSRSA